MNFRLIYLLLFVGMIGCADGNTSAQNANHSGWGKPNELAVQQSRSPQPVNRLGAHFDQSSDARADRRAEFQAAVAKNMGAQLPANSFSSEETDANAFGQPPSNSQTHNTAFKPEPQAGNSFGGSTLQPINNSLSPQQNNSQIASTSSNGSFDIPFCTVEFIDDIELPAQESGQIKRLFVREGDPVQAGKVVGQIDDELYLRMLQQAKLRLSIAQQKANDTTSLMAAENEINLNNVIYRRTQDLNLKGSAPKSELQEAEFRYKLALLKKSAAQNEIDSANGEAKIEMARVGEVEERIRRHSISTNFDCYVIEIFRHPLEWVNAGDKVARVVRMDKLWVQGVVSSAEWNSHELVNCPVTVKLNLARNETTTFEGKIVNVSLERQGSDQIWVKAEVENRPIKGHWVLQPNSTVEMTVHVDQQPAASATAGNYQLPTNR